jgi:hypothetical protein
MPAAGGAEPRVVGAVGALLLTVLARKVECGQSPLAVGDVAGGDSWSVLLPFVGD